MQSGKRCICAAVGVSLIAGCARWDRLMIRGTETVHPEWKPKDPKPIVETLPLVFQVRTYGTNWFIVQVTNESIRALSR